jgi:hypothetical protein
MLAAGGCKLSSENPAYGCQHCAPPNRCVRGFCIPPAKPRDSGTPATPDAGKLANCKPEGASRTCYDGAEGTLGKGACHEGVQVCTGGDFGECNGQVVPQPELCNAADDDCDGRDDEDFDLTTSNDNCGVCNHRCPSDRSCCNSLCVDTQNDGENCGACTAKCDSQSVCCNGMCRATQNDVANCGACGSACGAAEICCYGTCANPQTDANHCGASCAHCSASEGCCAGVCSDLGTAQHCGSCETVCDVSSQVCCNHACTTDLRSCGDL